MINYYFFPGNQGNLHKHHKHKYAKLELFQIWDGCSNHLGRVSDLKFFQNGQNKQGTLPNNLHATSHNIIMLWETNPKACTKFNQCINTAKKHFQGILWKSMQWTWSQKYLKEKFPDENFQVVFATVVF